jgi:hypothetical protein
VGDFRPPQAAIDLVASYARRRGGEVEIVLAEPAPGGAVDALILRKGATAVTAPVELVDGPGRRIVARAPREALADGIWALTLRSGDGAGRVGARLLVQGDRPLVLLWGGGNPKSRLPDPRPSATTGRQVAALAGRALDGALAALPAERAQRLRSQARSAARRLLK